MEKKQDNKIVLCTMKIVILVGIFDYRSDLVFGGISAPSGSNSNVHKIFTKN